MLRGDFTFDPDATYEVETDPSNTDADLIHVTGTAFLNGASVHKIGLNGTYAPSSVYKILTADAGIDGTFGTVLSDYVFLDAALDYDANNVYLQLVRNNINFGDIANTSNQQGAGTALQSFGPGHPLFDEIVTMTDDEARAAYDALSGEAHASSSASQFMTVTEIRQHLLNRLAKIFGAGGGIASLAGAPAAGDAVPGGVSLWGHLFGSWGRTDTNGNAAAIDRDLYGFIGGADREISPGVRAGFALGYARAGYDVTARASAGDSDNFHVAAYAGTALGDAALKGLVTYGYGRADTQRRVVVGGLTNDLTASYGTHTFQAATEASLDFDRGALTVGSASSTIGVSTLGLRLQHEAGGISLGGAAAWRHAFGDVEPALSVAFASAPASAFTVRGTPISENALALDLSVGARLGEGATLTFGYAGELASDARNHGARAELRFTF